jgi:hypothetical protein
MRARRNKPVPCWTREGMRATTKMGVFQQPAGVVSPCPLYSDAAPSWDDAPQGGRGVVSQRRNASFSVARDRYRRRKVWCSLGCACPACSRSLPLAPDLISPPSSIAFLPGRFCSGTGWAAIERSTGFRFRDPDQANLAFRKKGLQHFFQAPILLSFAGIDDYSFHELFLFRAAKP